MKKIIALFMAFVMLFSVNSITAYAASTDAYIDENGVYHRWSNGAYISSTLDYDGMIEDFQRVILDRDFDEPLTARSEQNLYGVYYSAPLNVDTNDYDATREAQHKLAEKIEQSIFLMNEQNPRLGQHLYNSITLTCSVNIYPSAYDTPIDGVVYNTCRIFIDVDYITTLAEEIYVEEFAKLFSREYINPTDSDYQKVKTIYDFVLRNTTYDDELFHDKRNGSYSRESDRYRVSHSAYGAIIGNRLIYEDNKQTVINPNNDINANFDKYDLEESREYIATQVAADFDKFFDYKYSVSGQKIISLADKSNPFKHKPNGRAVCEGYSNLFYFLCRYNGIETRIVDGDYMEYVSSSPEEIKSIFGDLSSGKESDPHEWNYVKLDDNTGKGEQWYMVDTTWGSQLSLINIDYNNYDYFLIGSTYYSDEKTINPHYSVKNHQQPYTQNGAIPQLFDWYRDDEKESNVVSKDDYYIQIVDVSSFAFDDEHSVLIERKTDYGDGIDKYAYLMQDQNHAVRVMFNDDQKQIDGVEGFDYNGCLDSEYLLIIPYLTGSEYVTSPLTNIKNVKTYTLTAYGLSQDGATTRFEVPFKIAALDMSNNSSYYSEIHIENESNYVGQEIIPIAHIVDSYNNSLTTKDYDIKIYQNGKETELKDMGVYQVKIVFKGNYKGVFSFDFTIGKIDLSQITLDQYTLPYIPKYFREKDGLTEASQFFDQGVSSLTVGSVVLTRDDYYVVSEGEVNSYGDSGKLMVVAKPNRSNLIADTKAVGEYTVAQKFSLGESTTSRNGMNFNGRAADSNSVNKIYYDGTAKKPTTFDNLDKYLERGKDYKIVSYSNNINAGSANVVIEGINGCTGRATMYFEINRADITKSKVTASISGTTVNEKVEWNGKILVKDKDYKKTVEKTSSGYLLTITGINNFAGTHRTAITVAPIVTNSYIAPTASGNTIKLSKTSYVYSGSYCKPSVVFKNNKGKTVNTYYYTVKYSSNKSVGTAKVVVTLRNGFSGSFTMYFSILPKSTTISSLTAVSKGFTVKWKKQSTQTTGYQIQIATDSKFTKNKKLYTVTKNSTVSKKLTKFTGKKKYYVRIRTYKTVSGKKYYSSWSTAKYVTTKK